MTRTHSSPSAVFIFILTVAFFGTSFPAIRAAEEAFSPASIVLLRAVFASIALGLLALAFRARLGMPWKDIALAALVGQLGISMFQWVLNIAIEQTSTGVAATITNTAPLVSMALAAVLLRESIPFMRWAGVLISLGGIFLLGTSSGASSFSGVALLIVAALSLGIYSVALKPLLARQHPLAVTFHGTWPGIILFAWATPTALTESTNATTSAWVAIAVLVVVVTCGGYVLLAKLLQVLPISRVVLYYYLVPPVAIVYSMILFGEIPSGQEIAGVVVVIAGVAIALSTPVKRRDPTPDSHLPRSRVG